MDVKNALMSIPRDTNEVWRRCFKRIEEKRFISKAIPLLNWLCFSIRPLTLGELIAALAIPEDWSEDFDVDLYRIEDPLDLLDICSGLVDGDRDPETGQMNEDEVSVRLAHSSVKEWLQSKDSFACIPDKSPFSEPEAHGLLAKACMQHLVQLNEEERITEDNLARNSFATYAAMYWRAHLRHSENNPNGVLLACKLLMNNEARRNWHTQSDLDTTKSARGIQSTPLIYAAEAGLDSVIECLIKEYHVNVNEVLEEMSALRMAVYAEQISTVKLLLEAGADATARVGRGWLKPILSAACYKGPLEIIRMLLEAGAEVNISAENGWEHECVTPIVVAAGRKDDDAVEYLLACGAKVDLQSGHAGGSALHHAAHNARLRNAQKLLLRGTDKRLRDVYGRLPLHLAVRQKDCSIELAQLLYFEGAGEFEDDRGIVPLLLSVSGNEAVCEYLIDASSGLDFAESKSTAALIQAAGNGFLRAVEFFSEKGAKFATEDASAIHAAAANGHLAIVKFLLQNGEDINRLSSDKKDTPIMISLLRNHDEVWKFLAKQGADLHLVNKNGWNACFHVAASNNRSGLEFLLNHQVAFDTPTKAGTTPFHFAALNGNLEIMQRLADAGANINAVDNDKDTAIRYAVESSKIEILKWLVCHCDRKTLFAPNGHGCNAAHCAARSGESEALQWLVEEGVDPNLVDDNGETALQHALLHGNIDCIRWLVDRYPDNLSHPKPIPPLTIAAWVGNIPCIEYLVGKGAEINQVTSILVKVAPEVCPLSLAVARNHFEAAKFLLNHGANPNIITRGGSPLLLAAAFSPLKFTELLIAHNAKWEGVEDLDRNNALMLSIHNSEIEALRYWIARMPERTTENRYGFTPLLRASLDGRTEALKALHEAGFRFQYPVNADEAKHYPEDMQGTSLWHALKSLADYLARIEVHGRYTPLIAAAHCGNVEKIKYLWETNVEMRECTDREGNDALTYACCGGYLKVVKFLIQRGLSPNRINNADRNAEAETGEYLACLKQNVEHEYFECVREEMNERCKAIPKILKYLQEYQQECLSDDDHESDPEGTKDDLTTCSSPVVEIESSEIESSEDEDVFFDRLPRRETRNIAV
ncbi:MAG: hypothetical protein Q9227_006815 [Pyrenula ochraceoflavens]